MKTRQVRKIKQEIVSTTFEEVVVKDEIEDYSYLEDESPSASDVQSEGVTKFPNKSSTKKTLQQKPPVNQLRIRSKAIQVTSEEIDASILQATSETADDEDEQMQHSPCEQSRTHCRFCLRRVAPEHLKPIVSKYKTKALALFRIRIYPGDPFLSACSNCLNLLDIFTDFKEAIIKAKKLLVRRIGYMESDGWDEANTIDYFDKCKVAVRTHRKQIQSMYDQHVKSSENKKNEVNETIHDIHGVFKAEPVELIIPNHTEDITNSEIGPDPAEIVATALMTEETISVDQADQQGTTAKWNESDNDDVPDDMDVDDEDYVPYDEKTKEEKPSASETEEKPRKKAKRKNTKNIQSKGSFQKLCDICGETICSTAEESHVNQHLGIKPYPCPEEGCGLAFHSRYNLAKHAKRTHKSSETHACDTCGKIIRGKLWALKQHQRRHTLTEKNYVCKVCGKGFTMQWYLTQHSVVHSSEMPFKCNYCGKRFNNKWSMKTHEKNVHEKKDIAMVVEPNTSQNVVYDQAYNITMITQEKDIHENRDNVIVEVNDSQNVVYEETYTIESNVQ